MTATVAIDPETSVVNTVSVSVPAGTTDSNPLDDSATDVDATGIVADGFDSPPSDATEDAPTATRRR